MIKLVIIDFDDTLCMTEEACFNLENEIAVSMGFPPMTRMTHQKNWGKPVEKAIIERVPGINPQEFMRKLDIALSKMVEKGKIDRVSEENIKALQKLKENGKRLAILTSRTFSEVKHLLEKNHHLNNWIEKIYHSRNSKYLKPDPRVFDQILEEFKVQANESIYIGDSVGDAICSKKAQLHFIALLESRLRKKDDFAGLNVDYFAQTFPQALSYIEKH